MRSVKASFLALWERAEEQSSNQQKESVPAYLKGVIIMDEGSNILLLTTLIPKRNLAAVPGVANALVTYIYIVQRKQE